MKTSIALPFLQMKIPGIFGAPQPSQVRRGSIPDHPHSRLNAKDKPSRFIKVIPAFAYRPETKPASYDDNRRATSRQRAVAALRKIHNRPASNGARSRLS